MKQLFYKVDYKRIPQSRYRKLYKIDTWDIYSTILLIVAVTCLFVHIFKPGTLCDLINQIKEANLLPIVSPEAGVVAFSVLCLLLLAIISEIFRTFLAKIRIKDINVADKATVETNQIEPESIFNKNIDEIIYFFEETKYKIVFFEDLDRLKNPVVFVHLRELNNLLNDSEAIKRRIVFVYALKDDIFIEKDRTKFFDFIIPVIPYINSTNSGDSLNKMLEKAKKMGDIHNISSNYVLDVSPFIDDMRLLLNIYNEFLVYKRTLQTGQGLEGLHDEPIMSLIIFKNLHPKDFADLQMEDGIVKRVFEAKAKFISKKRDEIHEKIQMFTDKLENISADTLNSRNELITSFASAIANWKGIAYQFTTINPGGYTYEISNFLNPKYDFNTVKITASCSVSYRSWTNMDYYGSRNTSSYTCDNFEKLFSDFISRLDYIGIVEDNKINDTKQQIEKLKKDSYQLSTLSLMELLKKYPTDEILGSDEIDNKLLLFMLRKGYINENYVNYINYFKENSITKYDMKFILSIKNREALSFNYPLEKVEQIIERLQLHEFEQIEILNIDILNYLLDHKSDSSKLELLIDFLATGTVGCWKFIDECLHEIMNKELFTKLLTSKWSAMWDHIYFNSQLTYERKIFYLI